MCVRNGSGKPSEQSESVEFRVSHLVVVVEVEICPIEGKVVSLEKVLYLENR